MAANELVVVTLTGGLTLFFLVTGLRGLARGHMTVVNPHHPGAWPDILGGLLYLGRRRAGLQKDTLAHSRHIRVAGAAAYGHAWLHIVLGLACGGATLLFLFSR